MKKLRIKKSTKMNKQGMKTQMPDISNLNNALHAAHFFVNFEALHAAESFLTNDTPHVTRKGAY